MNLTNLWPPGGMVWMRSAESYNLHVAERTDHEGRPHGLCGTRLNPHAPAGTHARCPTCAALVRLPACSCGQALAPVWCSTYGWDLHCVRCGDMRLGGFTNELNLTRYYLNLHA